jgi:hypothetical protein
MRNARIVMTKVAAMIFALSSSFGFEGRTNTPLPESAMMEDCLVGHGILTIRKYGVRGRKVHDIKKPGTPRPQNLSLPRLSLPESAGQGTCEGAYTTTTTTQSRI